MDCPEPLFVAAVGSGTRAEGAQFDEISDFVIAGKEYLTQPGVGGYITGNLRLVKTCVTHSKLTT
jgi:hypothetical protein